MKVRYDAYCGLNCGACPVGLANELNDDEALEKMAEEWGVKREDVVCSGCKTDTVAPFCAGCEMRVCAMEKGLEFCSQCDLFPCKAITDFRNDKMPHHSVIFENLKEIEKNGVEAWLEAEERKWSYTECNTRFAWYSETCSNCGAKLFNAVDQEKEIQS